jgi:prepilin-type N-terminal cleavage/methylation domain-containing protein
METMDVAVSRKADSRGFTLIEVLFAMVVFGMISVALLRALTAGDKIKGRGILVMAVSVLARNEAESIKNIGQLHGEINDTTYDATYENREFTIERKVIDPIEILSPETKKSSIKEIEITISDRNEPPQLWHFRLLQGIIN